MTLPPRFADIDTYLPEVEADCHAVRVTGRSKTEDIVDCTPDI